MFYMSFYKGWGIWGMATDLWNFRPYSNNSNNSIYIARATSILWDFYTIFKFIYNCMIIKHMPVLVALQYETMIHVCVIVFCDMNAINYFAHNETEG